MFDSRNGEHGEKIGGGRGFRGFYWVFVSTTGLESFFWGGGRKVFQMIFFRWW